MRLTIDLPDDLHAKVAVDALKKRRNSKTLVITEILRTYYSGRIPPEGTRQRLLQWRIPAQTAQRIQGLRREAKARWA